VPPAAADSHLGYELTTVKIDYGSTTNQRPEHKAEASSARAAQKIREHGFSEVYALAGGFDAWRAPVARKERNGSKQDAVF